MLQTDVALNLYDFVVRRPGKRAEKFGLRAYDEVILAPMVCWPISANSNCSTRLFSVSSNQK